MDQGKSNIQHNSGRDVETVNEEEENDGIGHQSRFSRRRFLQSSAAISPVFLSLKSHAGWGSGAGGQNCTIMVSGNASNPQPCSYDAMGPQRWSRIIQCRKGNVSYPLKQALNNNQISGNTYFNQLFLSPFFQWRTLPMKGWKFKVNLQKSGDVKIKRILNTHNSGGFQLDIKLKSTQGNSPRESINISLSPRRFHKVVVAAYLNAFFSSSLINYPFNTRQIESAVIETVMVLASKLADEANTDAGINEHSPVIKKTFNDLVSQLKLWV